MRTDYGVAQLFVESDGKPVIKFRYHDGHRFGWTDDIKDDRIVFTHDLRQTEVLKNLNHNRYIVYRKTNGVFTDVSIKITFEAKS